MQCNEFELVLEQADALPADAATHLHECGGCRAVVSDLDAIHAVARQMAAEEAETPERIWVSLRAQLEAEGLIRTPVEAPPSAGWLERWFSVLPRPALAGAFLSVVLAAAVLLGLQSYLRQGPVEVARPSDAQRATDALGTQLTSVERRTVFALHKHNSAVTAALRENLDIVDNFIALCEKSVREEPENELAREYLYGAYQQKAELLAMMVDRSAAGE